MFHGSVKLVLTLEGKAQLAAGSNVGTIGGIPANETHKTISGTDGKEESLDPSMANASLHFALR